MNKKRATWLVLVLVIVGVSAFVTGLAFQTEAGPKNCRNVRCAYPDCPAGQHTVIPPGQCCPVCVPN